MKHIRVSLSDTEAEALARHLPHRGGWHSNPPRALTTADVKILTALAEVGVSSTPPEHREAP